MTEDTKRRVIYCFLAILIALLAFLVAQNAQDTANINNVFAIVVNNTDLYPAQRTNNTVYWANDSPMAVYIVFHAVGNGAAQTFDSNISINGSVVLDRDFKTSAGAGIHDHWSFYTIVPKGSNYSVTNSTNVFTIEWREYPILSGKNGTLSLNQTFITNGSSFNSTYDATTKAFNANYSAQTFPNTTIISANNSMNSMKVNKSGDNMSGMLYINSTNGVNLKTTTTNSPFNSTMITGSRGNFVFANNWNESNVKDNNSYSSVVFGISANPPAGFPLFFIATQDIGVDGNSLTQQFQVFNTTSNVVSNLTLLTAGKGIILKNGTDPTKCGFLYWSSTGVLGTQVITCP